MPSSRMARAPQHRAGPGSPMAAASSPSTSAKAETVNALARKSPQPTTNPANGPRAAPANTVRPPLRGSRVPSSAKLRAEIPA